jgi:hypothetical protein
MKTPSTANTFIDEASGLTYIVMAHRILTDGELFSAIRVALLKRVESRPKRGETITIKCDLGR